jgi:hypothetical protein
MPFVEAPDTARLTMGFTQDGQTIVNVFHFYKAGGYTSLIDLEQLGTDASEQWRNFILPKMSTDVTGCNVKVVDISQEFGNGTEFIDPMTGTGSASPLPVNDTFCIKWVTGRTGRSYRGRTYHIGIGADWVTDSKLQVLKATQLVEAYNDWFEAMQGLEHQLVIVSYHTNGVANDPAIVTPVTGATYADLNLDSQRRRLPGRGT